MSDSDDSPSEMEQIEACVGNINISNNYTGKCNNSKTTMLASAEIDGDASEVIADLPTLPENNIFTLLTQVPELPAALNNGTVQFDAKFIAVDEEYLEDSKSDHVKELLEHYQKENEDDLKKMTKAKGKGSKGVDVEEYERAVPLHGDELFHNFLTRVQINPTQIMRYSWGGQPLPMSPIPASLLSKKCLYCGGEIWFELQLLPTIIPSLKICDSPSTHLEFGTVFVYACKKSCWRDDDRILMETIYVQSEPL